MTKVTRFTSDPPQSPYAPIWNYCIAEKETNINVEVLSKVILFKEEEIKEKYPDDWDQYDDGDTGLGADSLTARFNYFNVLKWDSPVCEELHKEIRGFHAEYTRNTIGNLSDHQFFKDGGELKVRCWANVMRKGQQIKNILIQVTLIVILVDILLFNVIILQRYIIIHIIKNHILLKIHLIL